MGWRNFVDKVIQADWKGRLAFEPFPFVLQPGPLGEHVGYADRASARFSVWEPVAFFLVFPLAFVALTALFIELQATTWDPAFFAVTGGAVIVLVVIGGVLLRIRGRERAMSRLLLFDRATRTLSIMVIDAHGKVFSKASDPVQSCSVLTHEITMYARPKDDYPNPRPYLGKGFAILVWVRESYFAVAALSKKEQLADVPIPDWLQAATRGDGPGLDVGEDRRLGRRGSSRKWCKK